jgi:hypothetical protein
VYAVDQNAGLLRSPTFDFAFIWGIALLAIATGFAVDANPSLFWLVFTLDMWLLGYHHVVATYTRLTFDKESLREHRRLLIYLPPLVVGTVALLAIYSGAWALATIYLYWQWFHYTRQSEGISKAYAGRSAKLKDLGDLRLARVAFYAVPFAGILHVSARQPEQFLSMPLYTLPVSGSLLMFVDLIAAAAFVAWLAVQVRAWLRGRFAAPYFCFMLSHFAVFAIGYILIDEINHGWLVINIWHNLQYILFVWMFNNRRFGGAVDTRAPFLSTISQNGRLPLYLAVCFTLSTAVYLAIDRYGIGAIGASAGVSAGVAAVIVYQTINFHHYIVDALIWKLRKAPMREKLGLSS